MKLRYFQNQRQIDVSNGMHSSSPRLKWFDVGDPVLQYEEEGFWYDVETIRESEEAKYDGEREMR